MEISSIINLLDNFKKFESDYDTKNFRESIDFNVFNFIQTVFWIDEPKHSRIIAFLLNPEEIHGQKNIFLHLFLEMLGIKDLKNSKWNVYAEKGNVDILITSDYPTKKTIIIENKSNWAIDQDYQIYRYWYHNIFKYNNNDINASFNSDNNRVIYLSPSEDKKYSQNSICKPSLDYDDCPELVNENIIDTWYFHVQLKEWLLNCKKNTESERLKLFIEDYIQFWEKTNNKEKTIMHELQNHFKDKQQDWKDFVKASFYINKIKASWLESFSQKLDSLKTGEWKFDKESNDYRWFLSDWNNSISFVYESHKGLTLWKSDFKIFKNEHIEKFNELFNKDFDWEENDDSNYVMNLKNKSIIIDDIEFDWIFGNNPEVILDVIQPILKTYMENKEVITFFKEIDDKTKS